MRRILPFALSLVVLGGFVWTLVFLWQKSQEKPVVFETLSPQRSDIINKTVAAGAIVPRREVAIKARVSGVVKELLVHPGQVVKEGELLAKIRIIPNVVSVNAARARLNAAEISKRSAEAEKLRLQRLHDEQLIGTAEYQRAVLDFELSEQEVAAAKANLALVEDGAIRGTKGSSNEVRATLSGTVLEVPVEVGGPVIESNTFNEGTTVASIADMDDLVFEGQVDESEVGKLREDMTVSIRVGALEGRSFAGQLEYIAPKGIEKDGTIEFEVRARVALTEGRALRANYSANADIILDQRTGVLAIPESVVSFDGETPYVEVETAPQSFEKREVQLGLSDGIVIELLSGVEESARLKKPLTAPPPAER